MDVTRNLPNEKPKKGIIKLISFEINKHYKVYGLLEIPDLLNIKRADIILKYLKLLDCSDY